MGETTSSPAGGSTPGAVKGSRRIDRILDPAYLADLRSASLKEVRARRREAEQEETDLSFVRRLLHGRIDIVRAELARRATNSTEDRVAALTRILAEPPRQQPRGLGHHSAVQPTVVPVRRRSAETLVADVNLDDVAVNSDEQLKAALVAYEEAERVESTQRRAVQQVVDACCAEITRRYRDGEAHINDLLPR